MSTTVIPGIQDQFDPANQIDLTTTSAWDTLSRVAMVTTGIVQTPAQDRTGDWIVGMGYRLHEQERLRSHVVIDSNSGIMPVWEFPQDSDLIWTVRSDSTSPADMAQKLSEQGVTIIDDKPGIIYQMPSGNTIVEFQRGIGAQGSQLIYLADVNSTYLTVQNQIDAPLSENQAVALAAFAHSIGAENFLESDVLAVLNAGNYQWVPQLFEAWCALPIFPGGPVKRNAAVFGQRRFEGSLFQTPSQVPVNIVSDSYTPGSATWLEFAQSLDAQRERFLSDLLSK